MKVTVTISKTFEHDFEDEDIIQAIRDYDPKEPGTKVSAKDIEAALGVWLDSEGPEAVVGDLDIDSDNVQVEVPPDATVTMPEEEDED